MKDWSV